MGIFSSPLCIIKWAIKNLDVKVYVQKGPLRLREQIDSRGVSFI